ncbi:hypothetical protein PLICRDRAFT_156540 [Plicaturopsis crispa FD-325 SS-3]|nr:hypothetical protein PLICRDRAFT_156540 [Plicaturopsis crispa FD-325 SS-3]
MSDSRAVLPQGAGYGIVVGIGLFFTFFMILLTFLQTRYTAYTPGKSDEFNSASRSVKPGLIASGIVSAWTWAATLLQSSTIAFDYGISGPYWYAAGATVQILLMAQNAAKLKMNAPNAHTFLEVIYVRWGVAMHLTGMFFGLATNLLVSSMLIVGSSATVTDLTGMPTLAACFLIPVTVVGYVVVGGMRATLLCDYSHTAVLYCIILFFMFQVYAVNNKIGSPTAMWELLQEAAIKNPVVDNAGGQYITMRSKGGLIFGVINITGNFATVFLDQAYWQRAIASQPVSAVKAFMLGGLMWFPIPMGFASAMGLTAVALQNNPSFPGYPIPLTASQVSAGLAAPSGVSALLGSSGAAVLLVLLFLAVTSASSAELIATSSIFTYDVYHTYINPNATEKQILFVSHLGVCIWGVCMAVFGVIFFEIGIGMGWLFEFMGCVLAAGVIPIALGIRTSMANKWWCFAGAWIGLACSLMSWLVVAGTLNNGEVSITTTGQDYPMLTGNVVGLFVSGAIAAGGSWFFPENYDFVATRAIHATIEELPPAPSSVAEKEEASEKNNSSIGEEKKHHLGTVHVATADPIHGEFDENMDLDKLQKAFIVSVWGSVILCLVLVIIVPLPLFFTSYIYTKKGFTAWIAIFIAWLIAAACGGILYPIYESRVALAQIFKGVVGDIFGHRRGQNRSTVQA